MFCCDRAKSASDENVPRSDSCVKPENKSKPRKMNDWMSWEIKTTRLE